MMREPAFWWEDVGVAARLLAPLAVIYGAVANARMNGSGSRVAAAVVCIGNLTVGGAGKTPAAITTARLLEEAGELPVFLTRGYGGALAGPIGLTRRATRQQRWVTSHCSLRMSRRPWWRGAG